MSNGQKYFIALLITSGLFLGAFWLSNSLNNQKIDTINAMRDKIAADILSTETRYSLLGETSCSYLVDNPDFETGLTDELSTLAGRLKFIESDLGTNNEDVITIERQYTILEIKDYILVQELSHRCNEQIRYILYFYNDNCPECGNQAIVLDKLHELYPDVRVYWLNKDLDDPAMQTLVSIFHIKTAPSMVVNDKVYTGFQGLDDITKILPKLKTPPKAPAAATTTATSTDSATDTTANAPQTGN